MASIKSVASKVKKAATSYAKNVAGGAKIVASAVSSAAKKVGGKSQTGAVLNAVVPKGTSLSPKTVEQPSYRDTVTGKVYTSAGLKSAGISPNDKRIDKGQGYVPAGFSPVLGGGNIFNAEYGAGATGLSGANKSVGVLAPKGSSVSRNNVSNLSADGTALVANRSFSNEQPSYRDTVTGKVYTSLSGSGLTSSANNLSVNTSTTPRSSLITTQDLGADNIKFKIPEQTVTDTAMDIPAVVSIQDARAKIEAEQKKTQEDYMAGLLKDFNRQDTGADIESELRKELKIKQKEQLVNDLSGQLNAIVNKGEAQQLSLVGQGRGIPEAIIGGQQAEIRRETAIAALPVQAQLQAAQDNLEMANDSLDRLFKIYSEDAKNEREFRQEQRKMVYEFATEKQKRELDKLDKEDERAYQERQKILDTNKSIAIEAAKNGASAGTLSKIANATSFADAISAAGASLASSQNDIVELKNGTHALVNKKTGDVISILEGGDVEGKVTRKVAGIPVTGYTVVAGDDNNIIAHLYGTDIATIKKINPNIKDWNNLQIGTTINVPQAQEDSFIQDLLATEGGGKLTDTSIQKLDKGLTVLNQLGVLQKNVEGVKTGPIVGAFKSANPWDTEGQTIKAQLNAIVPNLARGVYGEVGVLTDNDIKTYSQTIPNLKSTEEVRNAVLYITLDMIGKAIKNTLSVNAAAGRDVSGFVDIYTEMEATKNSILSGIPGTQIPKAFNQNNDDEFLNQFSGSDSTISNDIFFSQF